jgi:methyl-accepting chemotaxis protein
MMQKRKSFEKRGKMAVLSVLIILCADIAFNIVIRQLTGAGYLPDFPYWNDVVLGVGVLAIIACIIIAIVTYNDFKKNIVQPVNEFTVAISDLTHGRPAEKCAFRSGDEIGLLADGVRRLIERMSVDIVFFEKLSSGDYSEDLPERPADGADQIAAMGGASKVAATADGAESESDKLRNAIQGMIEKQRELVRSLQHSSRQIAVAAKDISDRSQSLAGGSSEQAAAIEEFSVTVDDIRKHAESNAKLTIDTMESINR